MIHYLFLLLLLLPSETFALVDYQLEIQLYPDEQRLEGSAVFTPDADFGETTELRLAEGCDVVAIQQAANTIPFTFSSGVLSFRLENRQPFKISYRGRFADQVSSTPVHNEDPSYGVSASISPNGTFLSAAADWYPRLPSDAVRYQLTVIAPAGVEAVTSGKRLERENLPQSTRSVWQIDYPLSGLTLSAGPYRVFEENSGAVPIYAYFYPESAQLADIYLQEARSYLALYEELFGPYPFHKFAIVENFFPTGYGFPSWTLLGSSVIRLPFIIKTSLGHEMAHSWWGTGVRVDYEQGNWSEGLTTYVADYLYQERESAAAALEYRLKILRDYAGLVKTENAFPVARFTSRHDKASQAIGYGKTAMLFHMLRRKLGDEKFWTVLKEIVRERMFQRIGWKDFERSFSAAADTDLSAFFEQWLRRASGPDISLQQVRWSKTATGYQVRGELVQSAPYYQLDLGLQLETEAGASRIPLSLSQEKQQFTLLAAALPLTLVADPVAHLFRMLAPEEIPPTTNAVRSSSELLVLRGEKLVPTEAATSTLLGALRKTDLAVHEAAEVSEGDLGSHDLLFLGASPKMQPELLSGEKVRLAGQEIVLESNSVFIVLPHPTAENRIAAWFLSADGETDAVVARKIPHYGKYSYLLFEGEENRLKGTLAPQSSPLKIDLETLEVDHFSTAEEM